MGKTAGLGRHQGRRAGPGYLAAWRALRAGAFGGGFLGAVLVGAGLTASGCGDSPAPPGMLMPNDGGTSNVGPCTPGGSSPCSCSGGRPGVQHCSPGGNWLNCQCNEPPHTRLDAPSYAYRNDVIELDATGSADYEGDPLSFRWELAERPTNSSASLTGSGGQRQLVPDHSGNYLVRVTAADPGGPGNTVEHALEVRNRVPEAITAEDGHALLDTFALDASASTDPDGDQLVPTWTLVERPRDSKATITNPGSSAAAITPDIPGVYVFELMVFDGEEHSPSPDTLTLQFHRQVQLLSGLEDIVDAERSAALDAVVLVSSQPSSALHVLRVDANGTPSLSSVALPAAPVAVSVSPGGTTAIVAHAGWLSIVELSPLAVTTTWPIGVPVSDVVADDNGLAYLVTTGGSWNHAHTLELATGTERIDPDFMGEVYDDSRAKRRPGSSGVVYMTDRGLSPSDITRFDVISSRNQEPALSYTRESPFHGDYAVCGDLWFEPSGQRVLTACGVIFHTVDDELTDMTYAGEVLSSTGWSTLLHASPSTNRWVALLELRDAFEPDRHFVNVYDTPFGNDLYREVPSSLLAGTTSLDWQSRYAFVEASGSRAWVIATGTRDGTPAAGVYVVDVH